MLVPFINKSNLLGKAFHIRAAAFLQFKNREVVGVGTLYNNVFYIFFKIQICLFFRRPSQRL